MIFRYRSVRTLVAAEVEDQLLAHELSLIGEDHIVCSSGIPHSEKRENSATSGAKGSCNVSRLKVQIT